MTAPRSFGEAERFAWLRLWRSENVGPRTFSVLLARFGSAQAALDALPGLAGRARPGRTVQVAAPDEIEREIKAARQCGARFLCRDEVGFPALLREIDSAPAVIAVRGRTDILERPAVAIVGSRNASAAGLAFADRLARNLAQAGYVIVSGFARGIDSRAHRASLASGTVAVLAGGHDRLYPADQGPLMEKLLEDGAAVSEMPFGWDARGRDFPRRNRIVSGLSLGIVVVEAARRSGSLITARFAAEQGREVFAVPGSPLDPRAEGTNDLIRQGAVFCTDADDVVGALAEQRSGRTAGRGTDDLFRDAPADDDDAPLWDELEMDTQDGRAPNGENAEDAWIAQAHRHAPRAGVRPPLPLDLFPPFHGAEAPVAAERLPPLARVVACLGPAPVSLDELARAAELPIPAVRGALLELEIDGRIEKHGGGLVSLLTR